MVYQSQFIEMFGVLQNNTLGFPVNKLGDIAFITKLAGFEYTKYIHYKPSGDIIMIRGLNCKNAHLVLDDIYWIDRETSDFLERSKLHKGDIVLTYVGTVGEVALIDEDNKYHLAPNVAKVSLLDKKSNNPEYWTYALMFSRDYIMHFAASTSQAAISMEKIRDIVFPIPPRELQEKIIPVIHQADKSKFDGFKSQFIEMFGCDPIGDCQWPTKTFGELFDISSSRRILKDDWAQEGVPFLRVRDLIHYSQTGELRNEFFVSESFYNKLKDTDGKVQAGDILVSATSTIGKCMIVQNGEKYYYKDADVLRFREKEPVNKVFFIYGIAMPTVENQINDTIGKTTVGHFLISKAATIKQPLPPIALQEAFERVVNQADKSKYLN